MSENQTDLSALPQPVREAAELFDIDAEKGTRYTRHDDWQTIRAELLRLTGENAELRSIVERIGHELGIAVHEEHKAESELAALRKRIADAPVVTLGAIVRGDVVMPVFGDPDKRVALVACDD